MYLHGALITPMTYDVTVIPSCAVTCTVIGLYPTDNDMLDDALPDDTTTPFTLIVATLDVDVEVTVIEATEFTTEAV